MRYFTAFAFLFFASSLALAGNPCRDATKTYSAEALTKCYSSEVGDSHRPYLGGDFQEKSIFECKRFYMRGNFYQLCRNEISDLILSVVPTVRCTASIASEHGTEKVQLETEIAVDDFDPTQACDLFHSEPGTITNLVCKSDNGGVRFSSCAR
jgi:hypothetical protein